MGSDQAAAFSRGGLLKMAWTAFLCAAGLALAAPVMALADSARFDIAAQPLPTALKAFAAQAHMQLLYQYSAVANAKGNAVTGDLEKHAALAQLLKDSGLEVIYSSDSAATIRPFHATAVSSVKADDPGGSEPPPQPTRDSLQLAQAAPGQTSGPSAVEKSEEKSGKKEELQEVQVNIPEILIKGSRILNVDVKRSEDDTQPYYILDSTMIEQSGASTVEDFLRQRLPMDTTFQTNSQIQTQLGSTSSINLRGLGANETLVLINGRRSAGVSFSGTSYQPDVNGIPLSAIDRIEVLPSSASAIYGGAAVGGVVNIILKNNYEGGELRYRFQNTTNASAPIRAVDGSYGISLREGTTNVMVAGHYSDGDVLFVRDRLSLVQDGISTILQNEPSYFYNAFNPFPGATTNILSADGSNLLAKDGTPLNSALTFVAPGTAPNANLIPGLLRNAGSYNLNLAPGAGTYGLFNALGSVPREKSLLVTARQEFTQALEGFVEFSTKSNSSLTFGNPFNDTLLVPATAPSSPFQQDVLVTFPNAISSPFTTNSVTQGISVGIIGRLSSNWKSELDYTWSQNSFALSQEFYDSTALSSALAAGTVNPFVDTIAYPLNLAPYLAPASYSGRSTLNDVGLRASGLVGTLLGGTPTLTIGIEHRKEGSDNSDYYETFPLTPDNSQHTRYFGQAQSTDSIYAEANLPLVTSKNAIRMVRSLALQIAGRSERYTVSAGTPYEYFAPAAFLPFNPPQGEHSTINYTSTNPTIGLKYQPLDDLTLRASYAKAFLPPTQAQLLSNPALDSPSPYTPITDPKNGETYNVNTTSGGNPNLKPQTSRGWDFGAIWEPKGGMLEGTRADVEYYSITQPNYITRPTPQQIVSNPIYASRVTRDPITGLVTVVNVSFLNATEYKTNGWDLAINYERPTPVGTIGIQGLATLIEHDKRQYTIGSPFLEYVGYPGEGGEARTKGNLTVHWAYRNWQLGWTATYVSSYLQVGSPGSPQDIQFGPNPFFTQAQGDFSIPSQTYHQIFGSYSFGNNPMDTSRVGQHLLSGLTLQFGIKNIFNKLPPFDAANGPYFYSSYGDPRLREYWIQVQKAL